MDPSERQTLLKFYCAASMMPKRSTCFVKRVLGLHTSLSNLTARRLLLLIVLYALASPALHQTWFALDGDTTNIGERFLVMFVGDLCGSLVLIYTLKLGLWFARLGATSGQRG